MDGGRPSSAQRSESSALLGEEGENRRALLDHPDEGVRAYAFSCS
jgi:hypothetical protein